MHSGWSRLFFSIVGYLGLFAIYKIAMLSLAEVGLDRANIKTGLKYGGYAILVIALTYLLIFFLDKQAFLDPRYRQTIPTAIYAATVLLLLKTVIFEELAFRGIGLAILVGIKLNRRLAGIISSVAFGLWHISSSLSIEKYNLGGNIIVPRPIVMMGILIATSAAGFVLCELRWRSKSLLAPILAHWFINAFALILAAISWH